MLYLDTSALIKKYVEEPRSPELRALLVQPQIVATSVLSRAETAAAFSRAVRTGSLSKPDAEACHAAFVREWKHYVRIRISEVLVARADGLAWSFQLRGYDAVHLASTLEWQDRLGKTVTLATFDRALWDASGKAGLERFPEIL